MIRDFLEKILSSGSSDHRRPALTKNKESSVKGLYVIGDLAGAPVIKLAMAQAIEVVTHLKALPEMHERADGEMLDLLVVGAGASGLNAALAARDEGWRVVVLEKGKIANTIENFPEGKWVYAEPDSTPAEGKLWLDGARKEELVARWRQIVTDNDLDVRVEEPLESLERQGDGTFVCSTPKATYRAKKVILATGQRGNPRKLGVPGEEAEHVYHRLYAPKHYRGEDVLVVGGGNSAVEAALTLAEQNRVTLSYRGAEFSRLFKDNRKAIDAAIADGRIDVLFHSHVEELGQREAVLRIEGPGEPEIRTVPMEHAFVLIGAELPVRFLKKLGIRLENEWAGRASRAALLTAAIFGGLWFFGASQGGAAPFGWELGSAGSWAGGAVAALSFLGGP